MKLKKMSDQGQPGHQEIEISRETNRLSQMTEDLKKILKDLFLNQKLAVLSTSDMGKPYCSLIAFMATDDLKHIIFATTRSTRKFDNLDREPAVCILVDNRSNTEADFEEGIAVTVLGDAHELHGAEKEAFREKYISRYPHLEEFVTSPTCAMLRVDIRQFNIVSRFQNVMILEMVD